MARSLVQMPEHADLPGASFTCLIADDNPEIRAALEELLRSLRIQVVGGAGTAAEALRLLKQHLPTAMIVDLRLGGASGLEFARAAAKVAPETAVILYTSYAGPQTMSGARAAGVRAVVLKQASPARLVRVLQNIASGHRQVDDLGSTSNS